MNKENADVFIVASSTHASSIFDKIYGEEDTLKICLRKLLGYELFEKECFCYNS